MKKIILYVLTILLILGFATSTSALYLNAYFNDGTTTKTINPGENANYYIDIFPNSFAQSFNIKTTLFDQTGPIIKNLGTLEDITINNNNWYYSPLLSITPKDYIYPGNYFLYIKVNQTATDGTQAIQSKLLYLTVTGQRIINANFTYEPKNICKGQQVIFTSTSFSEGHDIILKEWLINKHKVGEGKTLTHIFQEIGTHSVTLSIMDDANRKKHKTKQVLVRDCTTPNIPPVASFVYEPDEPDTCSVTTFSSTSYDPDGFIVQETWYINGQLLHQGENETTFDYLFQQPGNYDFALKVQDNNGAETSVTRTVLVKECDDDDDDDDVNIPPVASFVYEPDEPDTCSVTTFSSTSYDPDGFIVQETWYINGQLLHQGENETTFDYLFQQPGNYNVALHVIDNQGAANTNLKRISVTKCEEPNIPPVARFIYEPIQPVTGENVVFTSTSYDPDGFIVQETWYINDQVVHQGENETTFQHQFNEPNTYTVSLVVEDNNGAKNNETKKIIVQQDIKGLYAIIQGPKNPLVGQDVIYDASASYDVTGAEITNYAWTLTHNQQVIATQESAQPEFKHNFKQQGQYHLMLNIRNEHGEEASTSKNILVSRHYGQDKDQKFGEKLTIDYHYVYGTDYGVIKTNEHFTVYITLTNRGDERLRNLRTVYLLPEYGISERSGFFDLRAGETKTIEFHSIITDFDYVPTGEHYLLLGASGAGIIRYNYFPATLK